MFCCEGDFEGDAIFFPIEVEEDVVGFVDVLDVLFDGCFEGSDLDKLFLLE